MATRSSTVTLGSGITLSYRAKGNWSGPAVVFLPGPTDSWRSYEPVLDELPASILGIAVSQRGHGDSDKPATGYRVEDFAADVVPLLDGLGIGRAVLVGHSGSCPVARRVAIDCPERVDGLVLEASPATLRGDPLLEEFVASVTSGLQDPIDPAFVRSVVVDTSSKNVSPLVVDQFVGEVAKVPARVWREMFSSLLTYDDLAELGRISVPTRLIWGDADTIVGRAMQVMLGERIHGSQLIVYPGAGHTPRWEDPTRFAGDVARFVWRSSGLEPEPPPRSTA